MNLALLVIPGCMLAGATSCAIATWRKERNLFDALGFGVPFGACVGLFFAAMVLTTRDALA